MTNLKLTMHIQFREPPFQFTQRTLITEKEITIQEISVAHQCRFTRKHNIKSPKEHNLKSKSWEKQTLIGHYIITPIKQKVNRTNTLIKKKKYLLHQKRNLLSPQKINHSCTTHFSIIQENHFAELLKNPKFLKYLYKSICILHHLVKYETGSRIIQEWDKLASLIYLFECTIVTFVAAQVWMEEIFVNDGCF